MNDFSEAAERERFHAWAKYEPYYFSSGDGVDSLWTTCAVDGWLAAKRQAHEELAARWRPIEIAPKDGTPIFACTANGAVGICVWNKCNYHKKPMPYWDYHNFSLYGVTWMRANQPTHWQPLPAPPQRATPNTSGGYPVEETQNDSK